MTALITAPEFDINRTEEYKLSIQVGLDGFSFSAIDIKQNELVALENHHFKLSSVKFLGRHFTEWINGKDYLQNQYRSYNLIYYSEKLTFIPSPFFDPKLQSLPAHLVLNDLENCSYKSNNLADGKLVFPVDSQVLSAFANIFPEIDVRHPLTVLDAELRNQSVSDGIVLLAYFRVESFSMILYRQNNLLLLNSYEYHDAGDFLYYVLSAMNSLGLNPKETHIFLAGEVSPIGNLHSNLVKYFLKTQFLTPAVKGNRNIFKEPLYRHVVLF